MNKLTLITAVILTVGGAASAFAVEGQQGVSSGQQAGGASRRRPGEPRPAYVNSQLVYGAEGQRGVSSGQRAGGPSSCRPGEVNCTHLQR
jgi:hypothetical protein